MKFLQLTRVLRGVAIFMVLILSVTAFMGCAARQLPTNEEDLKVVGTVGEYEVLYEELRFLVLMYREQLETLYGKDVWKNAETREKYLPELTKLVYEDLEANYAVLTLAAKSGITMDGYAKEVQDYMETAIEQDFGGSRRMYKEFLKAAGVTDHYIRFTAAVDHVYEDLYYLYLDEGKILDGETEVKQYILQNFVYVASICLINKTDEEFDTNRLRAEQFRAEVVGGADIMDYVKETLDNPLHCFGRGEMDATFEKHAFALENVGDVSEVFLSEAEYNGVTRNGWYFLQRLALTSEYVNENYQVLFDQYSTSVMNEYLDAEKEALAFVPNDFCRTLDLLEIEEITEVKDNTWILVTVGIAAGALLVGGVVVIFRLLNQKPAKPTNPGKRR